MERSEEKNVLAGTSTSLSGILNKRRNLFDRMRQLLLQTRKIIVIFAQAVLLPEGIIQFGSERQFANEVAERGFVEHNSKSLVE